jgi:hypothetical protein
MSAAGQRRLGQCAVARMNRTGDFVDPAETLGDAQDPVQTLRKGSRTVASGVVRGNAVVLQKRPICGDFHRNRLY